MISVIKMWRGGEEEPVTLIVSHEKMSLYKYITLKSFSWWHYDFRPKFEERCKLCVTHTTVLLTGVWKNKWTPQILCAAHKQINKRVECISSLVKMYSVPLFTSKSGTIFTLCAFVGMFLHFSASVDQWNIMNLTAGSSAHVRKHCSYCATTLQSLHRIPLTSRGDFLMFHHLMFLKMISSFYGAG